MSDETALSFARTSQPHADNHQFDKLPPALARRSGYCHSLLVRVHVLAALRGSTMRRAHAKIVDWFSQRAFISTLPASAMCEYRGARPAAPALADRTAQAWPKPVAAWPIILAAAWNKRRPGSRRTRAGLHLSSAGGRRRPRHPRAWAGYRKSRVCAPAGRRRRLVQVAEEQRPFLDARHAAWLTYWQARSLQLHNRWPRAPRGCNHCWTPKPRRTGRRPAPACPGLIGQCADRNGQWTRAIELYQQRSTRSRPTAIGRGCRVPLGLGYAHMDLALNSWGQRESREMPPPSPKQTL